MQLDQTIKRITDPYGYSSKPSNHKYSGYKIEFEKVKHTARLARYVK